MLKLFVTLMFTYHAAAITPTPNTVTLAKNLILAEINSVTIVNSAGTEFPLVGGFVRVSFHDCIGNGGCDGCIDHSIEDNAGLKRYTDILDRVYQASFIGKISRADFYALAAITALEKATEATSDKFLGGNRMKFGREDCCTSPEEDSRNNFPRSIGNLKETLAYFAKEFNFTPEQVVALLGAHTLGRAHIEESGNEGRWVRSTNDAVGVNPASVLDNKYYEEVLRGLFWHQVDVVFNGATQPQFQDPFTPANDLESRQNPHQLPMIFNSDICFVINFTIIDSIGHINCQPCHPSLIGRGSQNCCQISSTKSLVDLYASNNTKWLNDFTDIFMEMISRNPKTLEPISSSRDQRSDYIINHLDEITMGSLF